MAAVSKSGTPTLSTLAPPTNSQLAGLVCGEDIAAGDACYVKSDGKVWRSKATVTSNTCDAQGKVHGYAAKAAKSGEAVTLYFDVEFNYGSGLTPGNNVYLDDTTFGAINDAPAAAFITTANLTPTGTTMNEDKHQGLLLPIGYIVDATRIRLCPSRY